MNNEDNVELTELVALREERAALEEKKADNARRRKEYEEEYSAKIEKLEKKRSLVKIIRIADFGMKFFAAVSFVLALFSLHEARDRIQVLEAKVADLETRRP